MRFKLTKELCYLAGLTGRFHESERSAVGIKTTNEEIEERFIKIALGLGVDSRKIVIEENESSKHIYFYHSKISRMIREILKERSALPKRRRELAIEFIAGTFDASGHRTREKVTIGKLEKSDELLLELMGVHTVSSKILNIGTFFSLIKGKSVISVSLEPI